MSLINFELKKINGHTKLVKEATGWRLKDLKIYIEIFYCRLKGKAI
jgi:hypothetical protein